MVNLIPGILAVHEIRPKVTVIIPCYNREKFICQTIDSTLSQSYKYCEIVVVDDGSTDGTHTILERYGDKIFLLEHPDRVNRGQSASINLAIKKTDSDYIAILDSNDLWGKNKIETQVEFLEKNQDYGIVYSNGYATDEYGNKLFRFYPDWHFESSDPNRILIDCYFLLPTNALVRRAAFEKAGYFDESLRSAQDHDMLIRLAEICKIGYINEGLFYYRKHNDSISHTKADIRWKNGFKILHKASKRYNYPFKTRRKRFAVLCFRMAQCNFENKKFISGIIFF